MAFRHSTLAVIPARNEARFIGEVVRITRLHVARVLVVDDNSEDATGVEAAAAGAEVVTRLETPGKGGAIKTGIRHAISDPSWNQLLCLDGDGQHLPAEIPRLLAAAEETDAGIVLGNRMHNPEGMPWMRRTVNRFVSREICELCRQEIPDTQCGFRLFRRDLLPILLCDASSFDYETEVLLLAARAGIKITTVPVTSRYGAERSKINPISDTIRYFTLMHRYRSGVPSESIEMPVESIRAGQEF